MSKLHSCNSGYLRRRKFDPRPFILKIHFIHILQEDFADSSDDEEVVSSAPTPEAIVAC